MDIRLSDRGSPFGISQVVEAFDRVTPKAMIGVHDVDEAVIHAMGVAAGTLIDKPIVEFEEGLEMGRSIAFLIVNSVH